MSIIIININYINYNYYQLFGNVDCIKIYSYVKLILQIINDITETDYQLQILIKHKI